jgi:PPM family protein phosphatase
MRFAVYQLSRKGGREKNEDRMGYCYTREAGLFILADGMGGHPEGEVAAQISLQTLAAQFQSTAKPKLEDPLRFLNDAIMAAHHEMVRYATEKALLDTPRTTIVACLVQGDQAWWAHCGDSRLYLVRGGKLAARTRDHSYSELQQALPASAGLPERVNRNVLFTCLGSPGRPVVDAAGPLKLNAGDRVMLCSDGLWGNLGDPEITQALAQVDIAKAVPNLVESALRQGGVRCDNVTVLAVDFEGAESVDKAVSTEELDKDGFASTIQASLVGGDTGYDELDEEEIERSIREINDAIARSSAKRG